MPYILTGGSTEQPEQRLDAEKPWVGVRLDGIGAGIRNWTDALLHGEDTYANRVEHNAQKQPSKVQMLEKQKTTKAAREFLDERSGAVKEEIFAQLRLSKESVNGMPMKYFYQPSLQFGSGPHGIANAFAAEKKFGASARRLILNGGKQLSPVFPGKEDTNFFNPATLPKANPDVDPLRGILELTSTAVGGSEKPSTGNVGELLIRAAVLLDSPIINETFIDGVEVHREDDDWDVDALFRVKMTVTTYTGEKTDRKTHRQTLYCYTDQITDAMGLGETRIPVALDEVLFDDKPVKIEELLTNAQMAAEEDIDAKALRGWITWQVKQDRSVSAADIAQQIGLDGKKATDFTTRFIVPAQVEESVSHYGMRKMIAAEMLDGKKNMVTNDELPGIVGALHFIPGMTDRRTNKLDNPGGAPDILGKNPGKIAVIGGGYTALVCAGALADEFEERGLNPGDAPVTWIGDNIDPKTSAVVEAKGCVNMRPLGQGVLGGVTCTGIDQFDDNGTTRYKVHYAEGGYRNGRVVLREGGQVRTEVFDHVIVAAGFDNMVADKFGEQAESVRLQTGYAFDGRLDTQIAVSSELTEANGEALPPGAYRVAGPANNAIPSENRAERVCSPSEALDLFMDKHGGAYEKDPVGSELHAMLFDSDIVRRRLLVQMVENALGRKPQPPEILEQFEALRSSDTVLAALFARIADAVSDKYEGPLAHPGDLKKMHKQLPQMIGKMLEETDQNTVPSKIRQDFNTLCERYPFSLGRIAMLLAEGHVPSPALMEQLQVDRQNESSGERPNLNEVLNDIENPYNNSSVDSLDQMMHRTLDDGEDEEANFYRQGVLQVDDPVRRSFIDQPLGKGHKRVLRYCSEEEKAEIALPVRAKESADGAGPDATDWRERAMGCKMRIVHALGDLALPSGTDASGTIARVRMQHGNGALQFTVSGINAGPVTAALGADPDTLTALDAVLTNHGGTLDVRFSFTADGSIDRSSVEMLSPLAHISAELQHEVAASGKNVRDIPAKDLNRFVQLINPLRMPGKLLGKIDEDGRVTAAPENSQTVKERIAAYYRRQEGVGNEPITVDDGKRKPGSSAYYYLIRRESDAAPLAAFTVYPDREHAKPLNYLRTATQLREANLGDIIVEPMDVSLIRHKDGDEHIAILTVAANGKQLGTSAAPLIPDNVGQAAESLARINATQSYPVQPGEADDFISRATLSLVGEGLLTETEAGMLLQRGGTVHGDARLDNFYRTPENIKVTGYYNGHIGPVAEDMVTFLLDITRNAQMNSQDPAPLRKAFVQSYLKHLGIGGGS
ncbi:hypothetical protein HZA87_05310 [Candidatus Uhrbacteria bacterium]|nr:hypothetical protein [Candidatus Uhrbacteria bacterium]